jgi:hypothetical protein
MLTGLCLAVVVLCACSPQQPISPASFEVLSLKVSPQQVLTGAEATVTAEVANRGGLPGVFDDPLMMNGKQAAMREVTVQPGSSKAITYQVSANKSGKYALQLGGITANLVVTAMVPKDMELKYDSGNSDDALWAGVNGGFLQCFDPPVKPFGIKQIRICGGVYGVSWEGKVFELYILDSDMRSVIYDQQYSMAKFPVRGAYPYQPPVWVDFDVPVTNFNNKFYVYLWTNTFKHRGIEVGVDGSVTNDEHSFLAQGKPPGVVKVEPSTQYPPGIWYSNFLKMNWMIRAVGTALAPE